MTLIIYMFANVLTGGERNRIVETILSINALMNQLDQFCNNFPIRTLQRITLGTLDGCKVKMMNLL